MKIKQTLKFLAGLLVAVSLVMPQVASAQSSSVWKYTGGYLNPVVSTWPLNVPATATSTFAASIKVGNGCFAVSTGDCVRGMPDGSRTVLMGDSITTFNGSSTPTGWTAGASSVVYGSFLGGYLSMLNSVSGFPLNVIYNAAVSGNTIAQMAARFDASVMAYQPTTVSIMAGTNDIQGTAVGTMESGLLEMYNKVLNSGAFLIVWTIPPRDSQTAATRLRRSVVNEWIRDFAAKDPHVLLIDTEKLVTDNRALTGATAFGGWKYPTDGTHPQSLTAVYYMGAAHASSTLRNLFRPLELAKSTSDSYDGAGSPTVGTFSDGQNILTATQSFNLDAGGTNLNSGGSGIFTGAPPTGWTGFCFTCNGLGLTYSTSTDNGVDELVLTLNATSSTNQRLKLFADVTSKMTIGKYYELSGRFKLVSGPLVVANFQAAIEANGGTNNRVTAIDSRTTTGNANVFTRTFDTAPIEMTFRTPRFLFNGESSMLAYFDITAVALGTAEVRLSNWAVREYSSFAD